MVYYLDPKLGSVTLRSPTKENMIGRMNCFANLILLGYKIVILIQNTDFI